MTEKFIRLVLYPIGLVIMFGRIQYHLYTGLFIVHLESLKTAVEIDNPKLINIYSKRALKAGKKVLQLGEIVKGHEDELIKNTLDWVIKQYSNSTWEINMINKMKINKKKSFLNGAKYFIDKHWLELSRTLGERQPTFEELIESHLEAYKDAYEINPNTGDFKGKEDFEKWLKKSEQIMRKQKSYYLEIAYGKFKVLVEKHSF